jgi:glycosyltransferase involved in cell wall biosynthesis
MKVLNVDASLDPITGGGTAERSFQMSKALAQAGIDCSILTTDFGVTDARVKSLKGVKVIALRCLNKRFYVPAFSLKRIWGIVKGSDVVHLMNHWTVLNALVYLVVRSCGKPYVVCPAGALQIYGRSKLLKHLYNLVIGKRIIQNASRCVAINEEEIHQFLLYGVRPEKITVIPNGIDPEGLNARDDNGFRQKYALGEAPFILFMGRLNHIKGTDLLVHAFSELGPEFREYHLVVAGPDGGLLTNLKGIVSRSDVHDKVHFVGYLGGAEKANAYHAASLLVIPSRQEAMSIVVLEAGVAGTPVLLTDKCGFNAVAEVDGGNVVPASIDGISRGLTEMLKSPEGLKVKGEKLRKFVESRYLWNSVVLNYIEMYRLILSPNS